MTVSIPWKHSLHGGFLFETAPFAGSHFERDCAMQMYYQTMVENVSINEILDEASNYLKSKNVIEPAIVEHLQDVENFYNSVKPVKQKKKAWVIYWEYSNNESPISQRIISIRDSRVNNQRIVEFIEYHYMATQYSLLAMTHFSTRPKDNPYKAVYPFSKIGWKLYCGNEHKIHARIVKNLVILKNNYEEDEVYWEEIDHEEIVKGLEIAGL